MSNFMGPLLYGFLIITIITISISVFLFFKGYGSISLILIGILIFSILYLRSKVSKI